MSGKTFCFNLLVIYFVLVQTTANYDEFHSSGWIPLTNDKIFNQIRRQFIRIPSYATKDDINILEADVIKLVAPQIELKSIEQATEEVQLTKFEENIFKCNEQDFAICSQENEESSSTSQDINGYEPILQINTNKNETNGKVLRNAKKITENDFESEINLILRQDKVKRNDNHHHKTLQRPLLSEENVKIKDAKNTYEVTEKYRNIEDSLNDEQSTIQISGYNYDPPKLTNNDLTRGLLTTLSKYNINSNDKLPNYALSRSQKIHNSVKYDKSYLPFNWKTPHSYNSLNHLPVNPLLAVLLSNYGHYLPGSYGISTNYNNLYGYLASNNLHNNKPFGLYKIFSDTDSSN